MRRGHEAEARDNETNQPAGLPSTSRECGQPGVSQQGGGHTLPTRGQPATPPARPPPLRATDTLVPARSQKVPSCTRPQHSRKASHTSTQDEPRTPAQGAREETGSPQGLAAPPEQPRPVTEDRERAGSDHRRPHRSELSRTPPTKESRGPDSERSQESRAQGPPRSASALLGEERRGPAAERPPGQGQGLPWQRGRGLHPTGPRGDRCPAESLC